MGGENCSGCQGLGVFANKRDSMRDYLGDGAVRCLQCSGWLYNSMCLPKLIELHNKEKVNFTVCLLKIGASSLE